MALKRVPTLQLLFVNVAFGAIWAMEFQKVSLDQILAAATAGSKSETGIQSVDQVLSRDGMASMDSAKFPKRGKSVMLDQSHATTRRVFLKETAAIAAFAGLGQFGYSRVLTASETSTHRRALDEPGPMLPPVPAILLTVNGKNGDPDEISVVWTFVVNGHPPQVGISVHEEHIALELVKQHCEFVLNVPTVEIVDSFDVIDMNSSRVTEKFALSGLTRGKATKVDAPVVAESPIHVECKVFDILEVPPVRTIFLADVIATTVHQGVCDAAGRLVVSAVPFFGMTAGSGEFYTMGTLVGHIGKSVGRNDIKY